MRLYETGMAGDNVMPAHRDTGLAFNQPERRGNEENNRNGTSAGGPGEHPSRNSRLIEPKPDTLWHTPNREAWATVGGRHFPIQSSDFQHVVPAREVVPKFHRPPNMRPLPEPVREGADASQLRRLLNLSDEDTFRLFLTYLSFAIIPDKPYPILAVSGPAGAAKSSFAEFVRTTIDPSEVPLFGMPRREDLPAFAKNNPVLCFDNLSTISAYLADDLCRLATGGGLGGRKFYTNDGEATFNARRPVLLTGINDVATRGDLADRTIVVRLEKISEAGRRTDADVREAFAQAHPRILAALLNMVVVGLRRIDDVRRERRRLPRMADFALWGFAVAPAIA